MDRVSKKQSTGAALVFVLMGLIALLALAVVFLSRLGKEPSGSQLEPMPVETVTSGTEEAGPMMIPTQDETTTTAEQPATSAETVAPAAVEPPVAPPPPPPVSTPDRSNLPPEG